MRDGGSCTSVRSGGLSANGKAGNLHVVLIVLSVLRPHLPDEALVIERTLGVVGGAQHMLGCLRLRDHEKAGGRAYIQHAMSVSTQGACCLLRLRQLATCMKVSANHRRDSQLADLLAEGTQGRSPASICRVL